MLEKDAKIMMTAGAINFSQMPLSISSRYETKLENRVDSVVGQSESMFRSIGTPTLSVQLA